jgi:hypothetical protein
MSYMVIEIEDGGDLVTRQQRAITALEKLKQDLMTQDTDIERFLAQDHLVITFGPGDGRGPEIVKTVGQLKKEAGG